MGWGGVGWSYSDAHRHCLIKHTHSHLSTHAQAKKSSVGSKAAKGAKKKKAAPKKKKAGPGLPLGWFGLGCGHCDPAS